MRADGWEESADAWIAGVAEDINRLHLLDPLVLERLPEGRVLDLGCGEGRLSRLAGRPLVGVDPTDGLLRKARSLSPDVPLVRGDGERLPFQDGVFDGAVVYVALCDIPDLGAAVGEVARVTRPGGRFVVADLIPFVTTREKAWEYGPDGEPAYVPVDRYFDEGPKWVAWAGLRVVNHHRTMETLRSTFLGSGWTLVEYREPRPTEAVARAHPRLERGRRVPFFHLMVWKRR